MYLDPTTEDCKVYQEYYDLRREADTLEDQALIEECEEIYTYNEDFEVAEILFLYWGNYKLSKLDREMLTNFYILSYCKLFFVE